jgi:hypothetical protein
MLAAYRLWPQLPFACLSDGTLDGPNCHHLDSELPEIQAGDSCRLVKSILCVLVSNSGTPHLSLACVGIPARSLARQVKSLRRPGT